MNHATQKLSKILLPKTIGYLVSLAENILVVPVLGIGSIPFSLLKPENNDTSTQLIETATITILPGLSGINNVDLIGFSGIRPGVNYKALVVGNPEYFDDPDWNFPNLPEAEIEAIAVAAMFNATPLVGGAATIANVFDKIESADVIYLATHGVASQTSALDDSFIALTGSSVEESRLTAREIQHLSLRAKLVVLSACQTGLGQMDDAGIIGLARAFKIAGAHDVVVSLWNVDDKVTAELMTAFMEYYINNGLSASSALRLAMRKIRESYPNPIVWAPFVVVSGDSKFSR